MQIGILGLNHKSAELQFREVFARACQHCLGTDISQHRLTYVLLSTCNRTEIYFSSNDLATSHSYLLRILREDIKEEFEHRLYTYFGHECFLHLAKVTAGIDSAIIFETEIQGQVKQAYEAATAISLCAELHFLFQKALKIGKQLRAEFATVAGSTTLENTIWHICNKNFKNITAKKMLFVGASDINCKIFHFFKNKHLEQLTLCNRSTERLVAFANGEDIKVLDWDNLQSWIDYDIVICATKSPRYIINVRTCDEKPRLVIDLSVPRNVQPKIAQKNPSIALINLDQINQMIQHKQAIKSQLLHAIEMKLQRSVDLYNRQFLEKENTRLFFLARSIS